MRVAGGGSCTDWAATLDHAERLGIGTRKYELVKV